MLKGFLLLVTLFAGPSPAAGVPRDELPQSDPVAQVKTPSIALSGRVIAPDDRPIASFTIFAGPGQLPSYSESIRQEVRDPTGRFTVTLPAKGVSWVGVAANGFAGWEGWVDLEGNGQSLVIRLSKGVTVSGTISVPQELRKHVKAKLFARRDKSNIGGIPSRPFAEALPTREASLSHDGTVRFENVKPDRYRLIVKSEGLTKAVFALDVPDTDLDLGAVPVEITTGTGRLEGRVWRPKSLNGGLWKFAEGYVNPAEVDGDYGVDPRQPLFPLAKNAVEFKTDENGRFSVDGVPAGQVTVGFYHQVYCVTTDYKWSAVVLEGQTTSVHAFDPEFGQNYAMKVAIGDGSNEQYESGTGQSAMRARRTVIVGSHSQTPTVDDIVPDPEPIFGAVLIPLSKGPISFPKPDWLCPDANRKLLLHNVSPGTYRLVVYDWLAFSMIQGYMIGVDTIENEPLFDQHVVVTLGDRKLAQIPLGAGCITGNSGGGRGKLLDSRPEAIAVPNRPDGQSRRAEFENDGTFCIRYVTPGNYSLYIRKQDVGYCLIDNVQVPAGSIDVGEQKLKPGSTVICSVQFPRVSRLPTEILAMGPAGVCVRRRFAVYSSFDHLELGGLWPGRWTFSVLSHGEILAKNDVDIRARGTYRTNLVGKGIGSK